MTYADSFISCKYYRHRGFSIVVVVVVVEGQGGIFALDVVHIVGPLNYSRCVTKHRHHFTSVVMGSPDYIGFRTT